MASAAPSRECSKCKDAVGSFNCAGCKEIFCLKHSIEHRQELSVKFDTLTTEQNVILQQMQETRPKKELLKQHLYSQIDVWKDRMIGRVSQRTEELRRQVDELLDMKDDRIKKDIQSLTDEIRNRREKEDFFEDDIERIAKKMQEAERLVNQSMQQSDIELHTQQSERINWKDLIDIRDKSTSTNSPVTNKLDVKKDLHTARGATNSNSKVYQQQFDPYPIRQGYEPRMNTPSQQYYGSYYPFVPTYIMPQTASSTNSSTNAYASVEKRRKKPLTIVNPTAHKTVTFSNSPASNNHNQTSYEAVQEAENDESFGQQFDGSVSDDWDT